MILAESFVSDEVFVPHVCKRMGIKKERKTQLNGKSYIESEAFEGKKNCAKQIEKSEIRRKPHTFPLCLVYFYNCTVNEFFSLTVAQDILNQVDQSGFYMLTSPPGRLLCALLGQNPQEPQGSSY